MVVVVVVVVVVSLLLLLLAMPLIMFLVADRLWILMFYFGLVLFSLWPTGSVGGGVFVLLGITRCGGWERVENTHHNTGVARVKNNGVPTTPL